MQFQAAALLGAMAHAESAHAILTTADALLAPTRLHDQIADADGTAVRQLILQVSAVNKELDFVQLTSAAAHAHMPLFTGPASDLIGAQLGLCSFSTQSMKLRAPESSQLPLLGVMPVSRWLAHQC